MTTTIEAPPENLASQISLSDLRFTMNLDSSAGDTLDRFYVTLEVTQESLEFSDFDLSALRVAAPGLRNAANGQSMSVAEGFFVRVDPFEPCRFEGEYLSAAEVLDEISSDLATFLPLLTEDGFAQELDEVIEMPSGDLLIMDRVEVAPAWRGRGLGAFLAATAINKLSRGCAMVATYPSAYEHLGSDRYNAETERLQRLWSSIGFFPYEGGIYLLDPTLATPGAVYEEMLDRI